MIRLLLLVPLALVAACLLPAGAAGAGPVPTKRVLVVYTPGRLVPAVIEFDRGLLGLLRATPTRHLQIYDEFLDSARFSGPTYEQEVGEHLRRKYSAVPPDVVMVAGREALEFVVRQRHLLRPGTPVVHAGVTADELHAIGPLPDRFIGVPTRDEFSRTIEQALRWQPQTRRLVVVVGSRIPRDRAWRDRVLAERGQFAARVSVDVLDTLPTAELLRRLSALGPGTVVFTPGVQVDGEGVESTAYESVVKMMSVTRVPVYGNASTFLGTGAVGGYTADFESQGRQAAEAVTQVLDGVPVAAVSLPARMPVVMHADWRQMRTFGLDEGALPANAVVHFREPSLWQAYRDAVLIALGVMALQAGLIGGLLVERRRRQQAELTVATSRNELHHASRLAVAGELAAAVAHEINQPLGAILSNADTAEMILESGIDRTDLLRTILSDIRRDDIRASEVIRRLRTLLQKNEVEQAPFVLDDAVAEVEMVLRAEARRRHVVVSVTASSGAAPIMGDRIQIQQVLINLVLNAMDAVADLPDDRRVVTVLARATADGATVEVRDRGPGVAAENLTKVFESFFSTKRTGMGLGLSIARTIVEAHGGRIRAEHAPGGGALFVMELPTTAALRTTMAVPA